MLVQQGALVLLVTLGLPGSSFAAPIPSSSGSTAVENIFPGNLEQAFPDDLDDMRSATTLDNIQEREEVAVPRTNRSGIRIVPTLKVGAIALASAYGVHKYLTDTGASYDLARTDAPRTIGEDVQSVLETARDYGVRGIKRGGKIAAGIQKTVGDFMAPPPSPSGTKVAKQMPKEEAPAPAKVVVIEKK